MAVTLVRKPPRRVYSRRTIEAVVATDNILVSNPNPYLQPNLSAYICLKDAAGEPFGAPFNAPFDVRSALADFDVRSAFSDLKPTLPKKVSLNPTATWVKGEASDSFRSFTIQFAEKYGTPPTRQTVTESTVFTAVYGSLDTFPDDYDRPAEILHPQPHLAKVLATNQPDYGYVFIKIPPLNAFIELTIRFDDGTTNLFLPNSRNIMLEFEANRVYYFRTGFQQLGLQKLNIGKKKIVAYEWRLMNDNAQDLTLPPTTEIAQLNYQLDYATTDKNYYLLCDNGMGGLETVCLRGSVREKYAVESTDIEYANGERDTFAEETTKTYEVTTAVMRTDLARHYRQLLRGQLWLCDMRRLAFVKIVRVTKDIEINPQVPYNALKFGFSIAQKEV